MYQITCEYQQKSIKNGMPFNINDYLFALSICKRNATCDGYLRVSFNIQSILFTIPSKRFDYHSFSIFFFILFITKYPQIINIILTAVSNRQKKNTEEFSHFVFVLAFERISLLNRIECNVHIFIAAQNTFDQYKWICFLKDFHPIDFGVGKMTQTKW